MKTEQFNLNHQWTVTGKTPRLQVIFDWFDMKDEKTQAKLEPLFRVLQLCVPWGSTESPGKLVEAYHHVKGALSIDVLVMKPTDYCDSRHMLLIARKWYEFSPYTTESTEKYSVPRTNGSCMMFLGAYPIGDLQSDELAGLLYQVATQIYAGLVGLLADSLGVDSSLN